MIECEDVTIRDVTLRDSPMWVQHYLGCNDVHIDGITVHSLVNDNNDGIDIDCCSNVRIANCDINSGDDAIVLKTTAPWPCRRVTVTNCVIRSRCNAIKCGTESSGAFEDITVSNCVIYDTRISGIALEMVDGSSMDRVLVTNITMTDTGNPIFVRLGNRGRPYLAKGPGGGKGTFVMEEGMQRPGVGTLRNVVLSNVIATGADHIGCPISGIPGHPIENLTLRNISISAAGGGGRELIERDVPEVEEGYPTYRMFGTTPAYGFYCRHVRNLLLSHIQLTYNQPEHRPALVCDDVDGLRLLDFQAEAPLAGDDVWLFRAVKNVRNWDQGYQRDLP